MTIEWTPKQERSRDRWRERGRLAQIQVENGWSREELANMFAKQAEENTNKISPIHPIIIYNSADQVLKQLSGGNRPKKIRLPLASTN